MTLLNFLEPEEKEIVVLENLELSKLINNNINMTIPWYLISSYLYYVKDISIISDHIFDDLCKLIYQKWDQIKHWHKFLVKKDDMIAGTCLLKEEDFPNRVKYSALHLAKQRGLL